MNETKKIEEYLSSVRHDLRGQLLVVREGTSMALEGLGNKDCDKCFAFLRPALESADKLNKLIEELLSTSRFSTILASLFSSKEGGVRNQESGASAERMGKDELELLRRELVSNDLETLKYELMNTISHLIRTPLTIVKESLSLILDEIPGKLNDKQKQLLFDAKQNTDVLIQSVETLFQKPWDKITDSAKSTPPGGTEDRKDSSTGKNTILIVEDQAAIIDLVRMRLEANNYEVITAGDGQEGLDKARKENPDLIILDVMLPKMHGYKVCKTLKDDPKYNEIPIILATGRAPHEVRKMGREAGADAYISKPFEAKVLLSTIKELLEKKEE